jgi:hypothetical protein
VGVHGPSRTTAGGSVVEDAGSAVARPVDAPEPHGSLVLGVVVVPLVSDGFLLARPSSCTAWRGVAVRQPSRLHLRLDGDALDIKVPTLPDRDGRRSTSNDDDATRSWTLGRGRLMASSSSSSPRAPLPSTPPFFFPLTHSSSGLGFPPWRRQTQGEEAWRRLYRGRALGFGSMGGRDAARGSVACIHGCQRGTGWRHGDPSVRLARCRCCSRRQQEEGERGTVSPG